MRYQVITNRNTQTETVVYEDDDLEQAQRWLLRNRKPQQRMNVYDTQSEPRIQRPENYYWNCQAHRAICGCRKCEDYYKTYSVSPRYGYKQPHPLLTKKQY